MACEFADFGLGHVAQREQRAAQLLLGKTEEEIGLVLARVGGTLEQPAVSCFVKSHARVVPGRNPLGANLLGHSE